MFMRTRSKVFVFQIKVLPTNQDKLNHLAPVKSGISKNNECVGAWQIFIVQLRYNEKLRAKNCVRDIRCLLET